MFDERKAWRVTGFIQCLRHTKGEFHGKPFKLLPWQEKIIRDVFGTVRDDDPTMRQYTTAYIEIPKKQGKSELGAAIALNMLANDDEWKAEVYSCASDRQQAAIVFDVAVDMVKQSPALSKRIKIIPSMKRMVYQPTGSIYQVLSSEVATKHGLNVSACIFDELHTQPNALVERYEKASAKHDKLEAEIARRNNKARQLASFIDHLEKAPASLEEWDSQVWSLLLEKGTVNRDGSVAFEFRNGKEINVEAK